MTEIASDEDIRFLTIGLLKAPTDRDRQTRIGASDLSNGCDRCLAHIIAGHPRSSAIADRSWMGRVLGTAFHKILELRIRYLIKKGMATLIGLHPEAQTEQHVNFAVFEHYGEVGGTIDVILNEHQIIDWKGSTRKKICILIDYLARQAGEEEIFGRRHTWVKLSEREYAEEMEKMAYKVTGYYGQQTLYMRGSGRVRASLVFIARDGTGTFDNPEGARYTDPKVVHDVYVLSFDYDPAYADALIARGQYIINHLAAGGSPNDFQAHDLCFYCSQEAKGEVQPVPDVDIEVTLPIAA